MKKKILLIVMLSMLCMGVVSAAGLYGTFEGYQIVRVQSNGQTIAAEDVPAVNLNGRTMVPIYMLKNLGVGVQWDAATETVNITSSEISSPQQSRANPFNQVVAVENIMKDLNTSNYMLIYDSAGAYLKADYTMLSDDQKNADNIIAAAGSVAFVDDASEIYIDIYSNGQKAGYIIAQRTDAELWINKSINDKTFFDRWVVDNSVPVPTNFSYPTPSQSSSNVIKSKIVSDFEGYDYENIYELDNGQFWKQIDYKYKYRYKYRPEVTIYKDGLRYYMIVEGMDEEIQVEPIG